MIFINYRHEDTNEFVTHFYRMLASRFGAECVFVDFTGILGGQKWPDRLREKLNESRALLAVIGKTWGNAKYPSNWPDRKRRNRLRLDDPDDWVRVEICVALKRGDMKVFVVLLDDAELPDNAWDCELDQLADIQHVRLRNQKDFDQDFTDLCERLEEELPELRRPNGGQFNHLHRNWGVGTKSSLDQALRQYVSNEVRTHSRLQLPLVSEGGRPVVACIDELRIDLPLIVSHERQTLDPNVVLLYLGQDLEFINDEFRKTHTNALLIDRAARFEDIRREFTVVDRLKPGARMALVGDPGCGKSTLLQWICHHYAARWQLLTAVKSPLPATTLPDHDWLPLLILCRDFAGKQLPNSLAEMLRTHLSIRQYPDDAIALLVPEFERLLTEGKAILLIDGLDEIPRSEDRIHFAKLASHIAGHFPDAPMLISSRVIGFQAIREELASEFDHLLVGPLDRRARRGFLERWSKLIRWDESRIAALTRQVCHTRVLAKLSENIFLLAMIAQIHVIEQNLPNRRVDIYRRALQWMIQRRRPCAGPPLTTNELLPHLEFLAYSMRKKGQQRWSELDVLAAFRDIRKLEPDEPALTTRTPEELLLVCIESVGLLNVAGVETDHRGFDRRMIQFFHQSFQEYFAGTAINHGHDSAGTGGPAARLRDLLATIEIRDREVKISNEYKFVEPVIADYWQDAVRMAIAEMKMTQADEAILMLLPTPTTLPAEARARAVFALQCLADEPNISRYTVEAVFDALLENLQEDDSFNKSRNTWMDEAQAAVRESAFGPRMVERLLQAYIEAPGSDRLRIGKPLALNLGSTVAYFGAENADEIINRLSIGLQSSDLAVRVKAAMCFLESSYQADGRLAGLTTAQRRKALSTLIDALEGDEATVESVLWALAWFTGAKTRFRGPHPTDGPNVSSIADYVLITRADSRKIEAALRRTDLGPSAISYGCLALTRERSVKPAFQQFDWIYELAVVADGGHPRRDLPDPKPPGGVASIELLITLLRNAKTLKDAAPIAAVLCAFGYVDPELIPALQHRLETARYDDDGRDEAMYYLGIINTPLVAQIFVNAADTPTEGDDGYLYSRGLFGLILLDNVDLLAGQIRKALPHSDLNAYAFGLAGSRDPRGLQLLEEFRDDPDERIRKAVEKAFSRPWMNPPEPPA